MAARKVLSRSASLGNEEILLAITDIPDVYPMVPPTTLMDPTGFAPAGACIVTGSVATQTVTLTGAFKAYWQGAEFPTLTTGYVSPPHPDVAGHIYWLYYDGATIQWSTDTFPGMDKLLIACAYWRSVDKFYLTEAHGLMPWPSHLVDHLAIGTIKESGASITGLTLNSTTAAQRRPDISECLLLDEDLPTTNLELTSKLYSQRYLDGAGVPRYNLGAADIVPLSTNHPYYNSFSSPNWAQTLVPDNCAATVWIVAVPVTKDATSQVYRFVFIQPQWVTLAANASAGALTDAVTEELKRNIGEMNLGDSNVLEAEYNCVGKIVIAYDGTNWTCRAHAAVLGTRLAQVSALAGNFLSIVTATAPITGAGTVASPLAMAAATDSVPGYMTSADHTSLTADTAHAAATTGTPHGAAYAPTAPLAATAAALGTGDGTNPFFQADRRCSGISSIGVTDWRGTWTPSLTLRANLCPYSNAFGSWTQSSVSSDAAAALAPDGSMTAWHIKEDATTAYHAVVIAFSLVVGNTYTASIYLHAGERSWCEWVAQGLASGGCYFDLTNGVQGSKLAGISNATLSSVPNAAGWYRATITFVAAAGTTGLAILPKVTNAQATYAGTVGSGIYAFGAQCDDGSVALPYRPNTAASSGASAADYTVNATFGVQFCIAPAAAAALTWTGTYFAGIFGGAFWYDTSRSWVTATDVGVWPAFTTAKHTVPEGKQITIPAGDALMMVAPLTIGQGGSIIIQQGATIRIFQ